MGWDEVRVGEYFTKGQYALFLWKKIGEDASELVGYLGGNAGYYHKLGTREYMGFGNINQTFRCPGQARKVYPKLYLGG